MENLTRQELQNFIKSKQQELDELRNASANGEPVDLGKINSIEIEIENAENELIKMAELEGEYDSGSDFSSAQKEYEEQEIDEKEIEEIDKQEVPDMQIEQEQDKGEFSLTITDWQIKTGIEVIPDEYIKQRYDKYLTEEEFKDILANENVPKIIQEPGKAETYLKTSEDWEGVRTSMSALDEAVRNGNFPVDVNDKSYILLQYDKDKIMDEHDDKDEDGYAQIDDEDIYGISKNEADGQSVEEEHELEEEANRQDETGALWNKIKAGLKTGVNVVAAKAVLAAAKEMVVIAGQGAIIANEIIEEVADAGMRSFQKVSAGLFYDAKNPDPKSADINDPDKEDPNNEPMPGGKIPH